MTDTPSPYDPGSKPPTSAELRHDLRERVAFLERELKDADDAALQAFTAYVIENYPPGCVLSSPSWHAEKLFRAAKRAIRGAP